MKAICISCQQTGEHREGRPSWCRCKSTGGPYHAPKGVVVAFVYMTREQLADRDEALAIKNEFLRARDAVVDARWTESGRRRSSKVAVLLAATKRFRKAERALDALQSTCSHDERSIYQHNVCERCALVLEESEAA